MRAVTIYTKPFCGYCHAAKRLLGQKGVEFEEIDIAADPPRRAEMVQRANGRRTVPQIFIDDEGVGGFDEIYALDRAGKLDAMLLDG
jgi:glutaredoxin 3